jgi:hypothetical protein
LIGSARPLAVRVLSTKEETTAATGLTNEGEPADTHGCDYYLIRDGKVAVRSTFRKV